MLAFYKREYSALPMQSARIAQSRESNLDSCRPMSLGSYRLESRRDLQTANKVCDLYPFSPERETFEPLPLSIQIHSVRLRCLFSPRYLYLHQKMYIYYFMLYLAESLTGRSYTEGKLLRYFPLWRERVKVTNFVCCRQIPMGFGTV